MTAHALHTAGENVSQLQNAGFNPRFPLLEAFAEVFIQAAQPRSPHAAVDAMKRSGLVWVNELAAGLGHGRSLGVRALLENQFGRNLGSDLPEGWVSALLVSALLVLSIAGTVNSLPGIGSSTVGSVCEWRYYNDFGGGYVPGGNPGVSSTGGTRPAPQPVSLIVTTGYNESITCFDEPELRQSSAQQEFDLVSNPYAPIGSTIIMHWGLGSNRGMETFTRTSMSGSLQFFPTSACVSIGGGGGGGYIP